MNHTFTCSKEEGFLRIKIEGEWQKNKPDEIINGIKELSEHYTCSTLLIDIKKMKPIDSILQDYYNAKLFAKADFKEFDRIAIFDIKDRCKANDFIMATKGSNYSDLQFFYEDEQEAIDWLLQIKQVV